jgi:hypothetical protein
VSYTPTQIITSLDNNDHIFTIFPVYSTLKDHICKHVLDPTESWIQLEPTLDVVNIRNQLMSIDCYSYYLSSSHKDSCKNCPYLYDSQCDRLIKPAEITYVSSISTVLELKNTPSMVVLASTGEIVFIDSLGIIVVCVCNNTPYEYYVKTAFREQSKSIVRKLSKDEYFDKAYNKVSLKYAQTGKILSLRI